MLEACGTNYGHGFWRLNDNPQVHNVVRLQPLYIIETIPKENKIADCEIGAKHSIEFGKGNSEVVILHDDPNTGAFNKQISQEQIFS